VLRNFNPSFIDCRPSKNPFEVSAYFKAKLANAGLAALYEQLDSHKVGSLGYGLNVNKPLQHAIQLLYHVEVLAVPFVNLDRDPGVREAGENALPRPAEGESVDFARGCRLVEGRGAAELDESIDQWQDGPAESRDEALEGVKPIFGLTHDD
jgi:hypothetical protein